MISISPTKIRSDTIDAQSAESALLNSLTDKEKYRARIATQFLFNVLRKKSLHSSQLPGEKQPDDNPYPIHIQVFIIILLFFLMTSYSFI